MLPALPTGMQCTSGASPSASTISKAAVFWPSMRNGLTELTTVTGARSASSPDDGQGLVEVAPHLEDPGPVHQRLGQLAEGDVPLGDEHGAGHAGPGRVGGRRRRGVAGRRAHHRLGALLDGLGDGHGHAAVLEGAGGIGSLDLQQDPGPDPVGQPRGRQQRRATLQQGDDRRVGRHREERPVLLDDTAPTAAALASVILVAHDPDDAADLVDDIEAAQCRQCAPARPPRGRHG